MQLGFVSAILPEMNLEELVRFAAAEGFGCMELMCWPLGKADRRYAGVTHIDVADLGRNEAMGINGLMKSAGVTISALGYYPNPLAADPNESAIYVEHLKRVIIAAKLLGVAVVNTFAGRDPRRTINENWPRFLEVWRPLIRFAEEHDVKIGIENCPMLFSSDEWPGGKNLAHAPAVWRRMFAELPSPNFGLNYDPSHLVWQQIDPVRPLAEFGSRIVHVHLKDAQVDAARLDEVGILAAPLEYHAPRLPGRGQVDWPRFLKGLLEAGYIGPACIEVEDRDFEQSLDSRLEALRQSAAFIRKTLNGVI